MKDVVMHQPEMVCIAARWIKTLEKMVTDTRVLHSAETWNERYSEPSFVFGTQPNAYLADKCVLIEPGKTALAVADGEGRNSVWLAQQGLQVDAFDISPVGVGKARQLAQQASVKVNYRVCSCDDWDWQPAAYDYVVAMCNLPIPTCARGFLRT